MSWGEEILRALLLSLGAFEVITNSVFLLKNEGLTLARKQHQELPKDIADSKIRLKVVLMLLFGMAFFTVSFSSYILRKDMHLTTMLIVLLFSIYGLIEAMFYKYWKTWGFAVTTIVLLLLAVFTY